MRLSIVAFGSTPALGLIGTPDRLRVAISDRIANGEAFPGERVVRVPRRIGRVGSGEDLQTAWLRVQRFVLGNPFWPLDNEPARRLPIEE